jgi:hypothetical protein
MFKRSQILDELIPPAHLESSVTFSSRSAPARDSVVNLLYHLAEHLYRGFLSADDQFRPRRLKWLKIFSLWFPGFRSKKPKWHKFRKMWYLEVFVSSYVDLSFCWDTLLLFLLFWILVIVVFFILCLPFVLLWQKGGVFFVFGPGMYFQTDQVFFVPE